MTKSGKEMLHSVRESLVTFTGRGDDEIPDPELPIHSTPASWARNAKSKMISFMSRHPESFESIAFSIAGEFLATFMFMFLIEAPFINNARQLQPENLALECIVVGFSAAGMIYTFYEISGGHLNPIITFSMMISGKMNWLKGFLYILTQLLASAFATLYLSLVFPPMPGDLLSIPERLSLSYYPGTATHTGFWMELTLSFILIFTVFSTMDPVGSEMSFESASELEKTLIGQKCSVKVPFGLTKYAISPIPIGFVVGALCTIGGSSSGGAFNPARVFGPALLSNNWDHHATYWFADLMGTSLAVLLYEMFFSKAKIIKRQKAF